MCETCMVSATGLRSGKGTGMLSKIMGRRACKHSPKCTCVNCRKYRDQNEYRDTGLFLGDRPIVEENNKN